MTAGELRRRPNGTYVPARPDEFPAAGVSLRSAGRDNVAIVDASSGELLGTVDLARAHTTTHEGAIYLHGGRSFEVAGAGPRARRAIVRPFTATGTRSPRARPTRRSRRCSTAARRWA